MPELSKLDQLAEQWEEMFGEPLMLGMVITESQIPIVEKCLKLRDRGPLRKRLEEMLASGIML